MKIEVDVEVSCPVRVASIFRAIGRILSECPGARGLDSFMADDSIGAPGGVAVMTSWHFRPDDEQVASFRRIWDAETGLAGCVIVHESPVATVDRPSVAAWN
jgi:hypothetical protein